MNHVHLLILLGELNEIIHVEPFSWCLINGSFDYYEWITSTITCGETKGKETHTSLNVLNRENSRAPSPQQNPISDLTKCWRNAIKLNISLGCTLVRLCKHLCFDHIGW